MPTARARNTPLARLELVSASLTYAHWLVGECRCGVAHGTSATRPRETGQSRGIPRDEQSRVDAARRIWRMSIPAAGTPVERYLQRRGITVPPPPTLRFAPALWHSPSRRSFPAMVAAVQSVTGRFVGIHRTFLEPGGAGRVDKRMLGPMRGGAVRLTRAGEPLTVCEGIETALSVLAATGLPVWSALSAPGFAAFELPPTIRRVVIVADGDPTGLRAARAAATRWARDGRAVRIAVPPEDQDANDLLQRADGGMA